jgi:DNA-directed RNA polymerase-3 subunit RPC5
MSEKNVADGDIKMEDIGEYHTNGQMNNTNIRRSTNANTNHTSTNTSSNIMDVEDEVVREIPVILSQDLNGRLYLIQHPLRPPWRTLDTDQLQEIRFKQQRQLLEMDFEVPNEQLNHNHPSIDDANNATRVYSIRSSSVALKANYAIGLYRGNEMYLTPLQGVLQMKPSFKRIDEAFEKKKKKEEEAQPAAVEENDLEDEVKPLQFRIKKRETERQVAMRQQQFQHLKKLEDDENWVKLEYVHKDSADALEQMEKMTSSVRTKIPFDVKRSEYLNLINPPSEESNKSVSVITKNKKVIEGLSNEKIMKLPIDKQIPALLANVHIISFQKICELLLSAKEEQILAELQKWGILVQGCWMLRSDCCLSGRMVYVRNYILQQFALGAPGEGFSRKLFSDRTKANKETIKDLLSKVATLDPVTRQWKLKVSPDQEFIAKYPEVVKKYHDYWEGSVGTVLQALSGELPEQMETEKPAAKTKRVAKSRAKDKETTTESTTDVASGVAAISLEAPAALTDEAKELREFLIGKFKQYGVCTASFLKQHLNKDLKENKFKHLTRVPENEFMAAITSIADNIKTAFVLKTSGDPALDMYRTAILGLFRNQVSVKRGEVNSLFRQNKQLGGKVVPQDIFARVMGEFAEINGSTCIFKSGNGPSSEEGIS